MNTVIFAYSRTGCATALRIAACRAGDALRLFAPARLAAGGFAAIPQPSEAFYGQQFAWADALVFVGSCGIAVRQIAPHVRDKRTDPAVLAVDELAAFVVPLLSGHIGGANALARTLAAALHATPVITTATDLHGRFSVDAWAAQNGLILDDLHAAKAVSAAVLEGDVPLCSEFPLATPLPAGVVAGQRGAVGVYIGVTRAQPFDVTLRLIPPVLHLGLGCRRGVGAGAIREAVDAVLQAHGIDPRAICQAASIDLKADEAGLLDYCRTNGWPVQFYSEQQLRAVAGEFSASDFVRSVTGVDNVCERAAMIGAQRLLVKKTAKNGVTVALAARNWEVRFG